jgi:hypothetical protein
LGLGRSIYKIWKVREQIFEISPDLKPKIVLDTENAQKRFSKELEEAEELHKNGKTDQAISLLEELSQTIGAEPLIGAITGKIARFKRNSK